MVKMEELILGKRYLFIVDHSNLFNGQIWECIPTRLNDDKTKIYLESCSKDESATGWYYVHENELACFNNLWALIPEENHDYFVKKYEEREKRNYKKMLKEHTDFLIKKQLETLNSSKSKE